jgi:O-antigen/teichoic acid export membrane protein
MPVAEPGRIAAALRNLRGSPLVRQATQMIATRGLGLAIAAAGSIWASRCLGPHKLGISGMILAILAPMGLLVDLNQDVSLVRRYKACADDDARRELLRETFIFRWALCLGWMLLAATGLAIFGIPDEEWRLGICAAFPLLLVTINQGAWVLQAQENMPARYRALLVQSLVGAGCYLAFFRPGQNSAGSDIVVMAAAVGCEFTLGWWYARRPLGSGAGFSLAHLARQWDRLLRGLRSAARGYWDGRWLAITGIVSYLYIYLQTPLVGMLLGTDHVGQYRTATTLLNGFQAFAAMIPALLYPRMIEWNRKGPDHLWQQQWRFLRVAFGFFLPGAIFAFLLAPFAYQVLYGPAFSAAAYPFAMLVVSRMLMVLNGIFGWGLWAQHRDRLFLALTLFTAVISLGLNFVLIPRLGIFGAATVCVISETLMLISTMVASRILLQQSAKIAPPPADSPSA